MGGACSNIITANPADVILLIFALIVLAALVWCIRTFFYAIFLFIFSRGDDSKVKLAWNAIRYMIIWLFITVMLLFIAPTLLKIFRIPNPENYSAKYIFIKVGNIVSCVSSGITKVVTDYPNNNPFGDSSYPILDGESSWDNNWTTIYQL